MSSEAAKKNQQRVKVKRESTTSFEAVPIKWRNRETETETETAILCAPDGERKETRNEHDKRDREKNEQIKRGMHHTTAYEN